METHRRCDMVEERQLPKGNMLRMFVENLKKNPDHTALVFEKPGLGFRTITYRELAQGASFISGELKKAGVKAKDRVAVSIPPSPEAVCAVIGVLWAGAAYVPVNAKQPVERRRRIYEQADIRYCLAASDSSAFLVSE